MMTLVPSHVYAHDTFNVAAVSLSGFQTKGAPIVYLTQVIPGGARTKEEARAFIIGALRRRMGLAAVRAMARHRLRRVPWIGVDRQVVVDRCQRGYHDPQAQVRGRMRMEGAVNPDDFLAHQGRAAAMA